MRGSLYENNYNQITVVTGGQCKPSALKPNQGRGGWWLPQTAEEALFPHSVLHYLTQMSGLFCARRKVCDHLLHDWMPLRGLIVEAYGE